MRIEFYEDWTEEDKMEYLSKEEVPISWEDIELAETLDKDEDKMKIIERLKAGLESQVVRLAMSLKSDRNKLIVIDDVKDKTLRCLLVGSLKECSDMDKVEMFKKIKKEKVEAIENVIDCQDLADQIVNFGSDEAKLEGLKLVSEKADYQRAKIIASLDSNEIKKELKDTVELDTSIQLIEDSMKEPTGHQKFSKRISDMSNYAPVDPNTTTRNTDTSIKHQGKEANEDATKGTEVGE